LRIPGAISARTLKEISKGLKITEIESTHKRSGALGAASDRRRPTSGEVRARPTSEITADKVAKILERAVELRRVFPERRRRWHCDQPDPAPRFGRQSIEALESKFIVSCVLVASADVGHSHSLFQARFFRIRAVDFSRVGG